jgi:serine/threonine protein phosphatase 1
MVQAETAITFARGKVASLLSAMGIVPQRVAAVPDGVRVYAVGDVHGCSVQLDELHKRIEVDAAGISAECRIVYLGDYVDRGNDSKGVIERLLTRDRGDFAPVFIKGNHEKAVLDFLENAETYRVWRQYGAAATLLSYGVRPPLFDALAGFEAARLALRDAIPPDHLQFLQSLELSHTIGDYMFVHAGVRPGVALNSQTEEDLLWIREDFTNSGTTFEKVVVHGHTPVSHPVRLRSRIPVDTGAYATGILSCAVLEGTECRFLQVRPAKQP